MTTGMLFSPLKQAFKEKRYAIACWESETGVVSFFAWCCCGWCEGAEQWRASSRGWSGGLGVRVTVIPSLITYPAGLPLLPAPLTCRSQTLSSPLVSHLWPLHIECLPAGSETCPVILLLFVGRRSKTLCYFQDKRLTYE